MDLAFKALASEQRREILRFLAAAERGDGSCDGEHPGAENPGVDVCACRIVEHLGLAPSTVSHHMAQLRDAGLVTARKDGTWVHYGLCRDVAHAVAEEINMLTE